MISEDLITIIGAITVPGLMFLAWFVYHVSEYIRSKRPHKSDDEEDNPITKFKDDLAEIYENYPNGKLKKLAQAVWNRVVQIEKWHNEEIHDWERKYYSAKWDVVELNVKCNGYREELEEWTQRCEELQSKLNESQEHLKRESAKVKTLESETDKLRDMLKEKEQPDFLIEKRFPGQTDPFIKITMDKEAVDKAIRLQTNAIRMSMDTANCCEWTRDANGVLQPSDIVLDGKEIDEPIINNSELVKKLRDYWGLEADKEKPPRKSIYDMSSEEMQGYFRDILIDRNVHNLPLNRYKVEVFKSVDNGRRVMLTEWILPATSINAIRNVLGEEGIQVVGAEELP